MPTSEQEPETARLLAREPPLVRVLAVRAHEVARLAAGFADDAAIAFRAQATKQHWKAMIREAQRDAVRMHRDW